MNTSISQNPPLCVDTFTHAPMHKTCAGRENDYVDFGTPPANVIETELYFVIELAFAGIDRSRIGLQLQDGVLQIRALPSPSHVEITDYRRKEFTTGPLLRAFVLPSCVDQQGIEASFYDGLLRLILNKKEISPTHAIEIPIH